MTIGRRATGAATYRDLVAHKARSRQSPKPLSERLSRQLARMPVRNTKPELRLRSALHALGLRFRLTSSLPGHPDVVLTRARIAVFVDGCFWHACPIHGVLPRNNREWWAEKLRRNTERDQEKDDALADLGWHVVHVWEHEDAQEAARRIHYLWRQRSQVPEPKRGASVACETDEEDRDG